MWRRSRSLCARFAAFYYTTNFPIYDGVAPSSAHYFLNSCFFNALVGLEGVILHRVGLIEYVTLQINSYELSVKKAPDKLLIPINAAAGWLSANICRSKHARWKIRALFAFLDVARYISHIPGVVSIQGRLCTSARLCIAASVHSLYSYIDSGRGGG